MLVSVAHFGSLQSGKEFSDTDCEPLALVEDNITGLAEQILDRCLNHIEKELCALLVPNDRGNDRNVAAEKQPQRFGFFALRL